MNELHDIGIHDTYLPTYPFICLLSIYVPTYYLPTYLSTYNLLVFYIIKYLHLKPLVGGKNLFTYLLKFKCYYTH
jgi:hypothetical protein